MDNDFCRALVDSKYQMQGERIRFESRRRAIEQGKDPATKEHLQVIDKYFGRFDELEKEIAADLKLYIETVPIFPYLEAIHGIGYAYATILVARVDIEKCPTVSSLWRYAGQGVSPHFRFKERNTDHYVPETGWLYTKDKNGKKAKLDFEYTELGKTKTVGTKELKLVKVTPNDDWEALDCADRLCKHFKVPYDKILKPKVFLIGAQFVKEKEKSPYRAVYDVTKARMAEKHPDWNKQRCHLTGIRQAAKVFLHHFWYTWRKLEGLPVRPLYVEEKLGHTNIFQPEDFGWPKVG